MNQPAAQPRLLYQIHVERRQHIRRFFWNLLALVGGIGAWVALQEAARRGLVDGLLLRVGGVLALGVAALFAVRGIFALLRGLRRRNELIRFYDQGFSYQRMGRGGTEQQYRWTQVRAYRDGVRQLRIGRLVIRQTGGLHFTTTDGNTLTLTSVHGNLARLTGIINPIIADVQGTLIARALRDGKSVRLHPELVIAAAGVIAGKAKTKLRWSDLEIKHQGNRLLIQRVKRNPAGGWTFQTVQAFPVHQVDNVGGLLEVARSTIKNHQPERFNIKTQGPTYR